MKIQRNILKSHDITSEERRRLERERKRENENEKNKREWIGPFTRKPKRG